jgi:hypothetical protein
MCNYPVGAVRYPPGLPTMAWHRHGCRVQRASVCETCGGNQGVTDVVVAFPDGDRRMRMCTSCKAERLERKRVRVRRQHTKRRVGLAVPAWLGYALLAAGLAVLLIVVASALFGSDEPEPECYPGAGFSCPAGAAP